MSLQHTLDQLQQDVDVMGNYTEWHSSSSTVSDDDTDTDDDMPNSECRLCYADTNGNDIGYCNMCINYFGVCKVCHSDIALNKLNICDSCDAVLQYYDP